MRMFNQRRRQRRATRYQREITRAIDAVSTPTVQAELRAIAATQIR